MYIVKSRERLINIGLATVLLLILVWLLCHKSATIVLLNEVCRQIILKFIEIPHVLGILIGVLSAPLTCSLYIIGLWFVLWGKKHKMIVAWVLMMFFIGQIGLKIISLMLHLIIHGHAAFAFLNGTVFSIILLVYAVYVAVIPLIRRSTGWILMLVLFCFAMLTIVIVMQKAQVGLMDTIATLMLGYIWVQISEAAYLRWFINWQDRRIFRHSDFN
ncbi:hypothetical protein ABTQ33_02570 [Paucilactobacillus suebicus]|uniref:Phosphatase n=1 Tax=Paucilactobacillus suebicus DSM 5007 = KCTC 3549 TaxID=1423807 RepID=A0A0R1WAU5_9LACO|nr:hypothetical protein [Paucilactobacillus suebicus]KRM12980.1 phosphatase [Paucilactobacillus suebicus DSM 5007 = KCTC 3549]